jgi:SAP domain
MASASTSHLQMLIMTKMLVDDLKSVCQKCGFSKTGLKKQLQQRVIDALAGRAVQSNMGSKTIVCRPEVVEAAVRDVYASAHGPPRAMPPPGVQRATVPPSLVPSMGRATTAPPSIPVGPGGAGAVVNAGHAGPSSMVRIARSAQPLPVADKVMQGAYKAHEALSLWTRFACALTVCPDTQVTESWARDVLATLDTADPFSKTVRAGPPKTPSFSELLAKALSSLPRRWYCSDQR